MPFELMSLPFDKKSLAPHISEETIEFHYGKHHQGYVNKLNDLIAGTDLEGKTLEEIIKTSDGAIFNNAAQVWNHDFYWRSLTPKTDEEKISPELLEAINNGFGSLDKLKEEFTKVALGLFGSGWVWLVKSDKGLEVLGTSNAQNPITKDLAPLLVCDVWEHAYYIDWRNARAKYLENFWQLVSWEFVSASFSKA